tara:strand:- start:872 stop:1033 length:162 start_codon:yes stop_codon:yes gene_type:complete
MKRSVSYIVYRGDAIIRHGQTVEAKTKEEAKAIILNEYPNAVVVITSNRKVNS